MTNRLLQRTSAPHRAGVAARRAAVVLAAAVALAGTSAVAQDDIAALQGATIVYAGVLEPLECPFARRFDCMTWPANLLRTKDGRACFATSAAPSCRGVCQGVLAADRQHHVSVFVLELGGLTRGDVRPMRCPGAL